VVLFFVLVFVGGGGGGLGPFSLSLAKGYIAGVKFNLMRPLIG